MRFRNADQKVEGTTSTDDTNLVTWVNEAPTMGKGETSLKKKLDIHVQVIITDTVFQLYLPPHLNHNHFC
jgi:hypothetical protein